MKYVRDNLWSKDPKDVDTADLKLMLEQTDPLFFPHIASRTEAELRRRGELS